MVFNDGYEPRNIAALTRELVVDRPCSLIPEAGAMLGRQVNVLLPWANNDHQRYLRSVVTKGDRLQRFIVAKGDITTSLGSHRS